MPLQIPTDGPLAHDERLQRSAVRRLAATVLLTILAVLAWRWAGPFEDTEAFYRRTIAENPGAWMAHNNFGAYLSERGLPGAQAEFEAALRLQPDYVPAHYNLGVSLLRSGHPEQAVVHLEKAAGTRYRDDVHRHLAEALADSHRYAEATREFSLYLELVPGDGAAWYGLGSALVAQGSLQEGASAYLKAMHDQPENPEPAFGLGDTLAQLRRYPEAVAAYRQGLVLAPDRAEARNNLGNVLLLSGQIEAAVAEFREALRLKPGNPALQESLQTALEAQANGSAAAP
jgi:tetratricopeptide (TPR) repeat protein